MKNQASLSLQIVDEPILAKSSEGQVMIRATSNGVVVTDSAGNTRPLAGQTYTINNNPADASGNFTITGTELNAAEVVHTHKIDDIVDLQAQLDNKAPINHTHQLVQKIIVGDHTVSDTVKLIAGDNVTLEAVLNNIEINVNAQTAGAAAAVQNLATSNGSTVKVFLGTASQWESFVKETGVKYLVYILEG